MRYRFPLLTLITVLPLTLTIRLPAAPGPDPSGVLDIGPPPKGWTVDWYADAQSGLNSNSQIAKKVYSDPKVKKLPSVAAMKDASAWLLKNLRVALEEGKRHLRLTFRAGKRPEQVAIINAFIRAYLSEVDNSIKAVEESICLSERILSNLESGNRDDNLDKLFPHLRNVKIPDDRAEITRMKQIKAIKWAR